MIGTERSGVRSVLRDGVRPLLEAKALWFEADARRQSVVVSPVVKQSAVQ